MGSYDNGIYQPIFSIVSKNANRDQKEAFIRVIEETLQSIVKNGMDKKSLEAGINYHEFRFREADFGNYPKGLMYGLQIMDSWLYDENEPFMHMQAIPTFEYLKEQISTGYFEKLIQTYLLDNQHGSIVIVKPEKGRTARMDKELEEKLAAYKAGLSEEELNRLVAATKELEAYQESEDAPEDMAKIPVLNREDITEEIAPVYNTEKEIDGIKLVHHEIESNGIGYATLMFDLSGVSEELLPYTGILQSVLGIIDTNNYGYGELFNEINVHTGGIGTSLELYPDVTKAKEKDFRATFEIKGKALYPQMKILFAMMREILRKFSFECLALRTGRICGSGHTHCLIYIGSAGKRVTDCTAKAGSCTTERLDLGRVVVGLVFEVDQPLFVFSVYIYRYDDGACVDFIRLFLICEFSFGFQFFHCQKGKVHKADEFVVTAFVEYLTVA